MEIPDELAGQTIECPACNASLAVPAMAAPPPASAQVQESAPQVAPSRKSKSTMSKLLVASVVGVAFVVLMLIVVFVRGLDVVVVVVVREVEGVVVVVVVVNLFSSPPFARSPCPTSLVWMAVVVWGLDVVAFHAVHPRR